MKILGMFLDVMAQCYKFSQICKFHIIPFKIYILTCRVNGEIYVMIENNMINSEGHVPW